MGEGLATHSTVLAWEIPWTEEPGGLQSRGSLRVRHLVKPLKNNSKASRTASEVENRILSVSLPPSSGLRFFVLPPGVVEHPWFFRRELVNVPSQVLSQQL